MRKLLSLLFVLGALALCRETARADFVCSIGAVTFGFPTCDASSYLNVHVQTMPAPSGTQTVAGTVTANQGLAQPPANAWPIQPVVGGVAVDPRIISFVSPQAVTQSGPWTMLPGNTPNTTSWLQAICSTGASPNCSGVIAAAGGTFALPTAQDSNGATTPVACDKTVFISHTVNSQLIAASGSTVIYVCAFQMTVTGTAPLIQFIYGTGTVCATGTVSITGVYAPTAGSIISIGSGVGTIFRTASGRALCINVAGTTPSAQGVLTYAQF